MNFDMFERSEEITEKQFLEARRKYLQRARNELNWSTEQIAKKLQVMETEYINYENGRTKELTDYEWEDILYFIDSHLKKL